jgi:hypothetical protein
MKDANPAAHERTALLIFWAEPAFIVRMRLAGRKNSAFPHALMNRG